MAFQRPTLDELINRTKSDMESRLTGGGALLRRAVARVLARVHAGAMHLLYGYAFYISKQLMPDTAESAYLDRWAKIWGVFRKNATYASFNVTFTGTDGSAVPIGTELTRADGVIYTTQALATIASGSALVAVQAKDSGTNPNVEGGELFSLSSPIAGVSSSVTVQSSGIVEGVDQEQDSDLLARLLDRIQNPPHGGAKNDYIQWALEVPGVTRAWVYPLWLGAGTVGLTFVRDNDSGSIIPDSSAVSQVQSYIDDSSRRPVTASVTVFAPISVPLNFSISGVSDPTVKTAIQAELQDLILREAVPGGTLLLSHINEAISKAQGEVDHVLVAPSANVTTTSGRLTTMGSITWL